MSVFCSLAIKHNLYPRSAFCYWTLSKIFIYAQYFAVVRSAKSFCTLSILLLGGQHNLFARSIFCYCTVSIIFLRGRENQQKAIIIRKARTFRITLENNFQLECHKAGSIRHFFYRTQVFLEQFSLFCVF